MILSEAFKQLDMLTEETFSIDKDGLEELKDFEEKDEVIETEDIIDPKAESEEELEDSYVGKVILDCCVCHSKLYKDAEEVVLSEDETVANEDEECPFCYSTDGFKVIGQVSEFEEETEEDEKDEVDVEGSDEEGTETPLDEGIFGIKTKKEKEREAKAKAEKEAKLERDSQARVAKERERYAQQERKREARSRETQRRLDAYDAAKRRSSSNGGTGGNTGRAGVHYSGGDYWTESLEEGIFDKFKKDKTIYTIWQEKDGINRPVRYEIEGEKAAKKSAEEHMEGHSASSIKQHNIKYYYKPKDREAEKKAMDDYLEYRDSREDSDAKPVAKPKNAEASKGERPEAEAGMEKHRQSSKGGSRELSSDTYKKSQLKGARSGNANIGNEGDKYVGRSTADQDSAPNVDSQETPKKRKDRKAQAAFSRTHDEQGMKKDRASAISQTKDSANESLKESINNLSLDTDDTHMEMTSEENGKVTITTEPLNNTPAESEFIAPLEDETKMEIEANSEEEPVGEEEVSTDVEEFDEESFDNLGESYLKKVYDNVESFKTTSVGATPKKLVVEGLIKFCSGKSKKTSFIFESKTITKSGKVKFIGENKEITPRKNAFVVKGQLKGTKLLSESLTYNYRAKDNKGKSSRLYGTVKVGK